jgi:hypothetical protein
MSKHVRVKDANSNEIYHRSGSSLNPIEVSQDGEWVRIRQSFGGHTEELHVPPTFLIETSDDGCGCWLCILLFAGLIVAMLVCGGGGLPG